MGQQPIKGYSIEGEAIGAGTNRFWKVYNGIKQGSNMPVTIFIVEKKSIKKNERQEILRLAKKEAMSLAKVRHPGVLALVEPYNEDENLLSFVTQRVYGNLQTLVKQKRIKEFFNSQLQLRLNIFPILETLAFLHDTVKLAHLNINPSSIYITSDGRWKIGGMTLSQPLNNRDDQKAFQQIANDLLWASPEYVNGEGFSQKSDVYSISMLILAMLAVIKHQKWEGVLPDIKSKAQYLNKKSQIANLLSHTVVKNSQNPSDLITMLRSTLSISPMNRSTLQELGSSLWLNDKYILTVKYLENITNYENKQQLQFLKGLCGVIGNFDKKVLLRRIVPRLMDLLKFGHLVASIVYITMELLKKQGYLTSQEFQKNIWSKMKGVTQGKQMSAHSLYLFVDNLEILEKYLSINQITQTIMPLYVKCFDCPPKMKELALRKLQFVSKKIDYQFFKAKVIPKFLLLMKDSNIDTRKKSLIALKKILPKLDSQMIANQILGGLQQCRKAGTDGFINAITISIYTSLAKHLPTDVIGSRIIPTLLPYMVDPTVTKGDFMMYKSTLMNMLNKIEQQKSKSWKDDTEIQKKYQQKDFEFDQVGQGVKIVKEPNQDNYGFLNNYSFKSEKQPENRPINTPNQVKNIEPFPNSFNNTSTSNQQRTLDFDFAKPRSNQNIEINFDKAFNGLNTNEKTINISTYQMNNNNQGFEFNSYNTNPISEKKSPQLDYNNFNFSNQQQTAFNFVEKPISPQTNKQMVGPKISKQATQHSKRGLKMPPKPNTGDYDIPTQNRPNTMGFGSNTLDIGLNNFSMNQSKPSQDPFNFSSKSYESPQFNYNMNQQFNINANNQGYNMNFNMNNNSNDPFAGLQQDNGGFSMGKPSTNTATNYQNFNLGFDPTKNNSFKQQTKKSNDFDLI